MASPAASQKLSFDSITRIVANFKKDGPSRHTLAYFEARLARLEEKWRACEELHAKAHAELREKGDHGLITKYTEEYAYIEDLVLEHQTIFKEGIYKFQATGSEQLQPSNTANEGLRLERVKIPVFDGNYGSWISFRDLFKSMVHENQGIPSVQKMQYLRSNLKGEAEKLIGHLAIVGDNYEAAWSLLCDRYDNTKIIAQELMQRWWNTSICSGNQAAGLREMVNTTNQLTASLRTLNINGFDLAIVFMLNCKLDRDSRAEWQKLISDSREVPSLQKFITFLTQRFTMLETLTLAKPFSEVKPQKKVTTHTTQVSSLRCAMCNEQHRLFECEQFKKATVVARRELVKNTRSCFNCLSDKHAVKQCPSKKTCKLCSKRHNTLLHATDATTLKPTSSEVPKSKSTTTQMQAHNAMLCNTQVLLATALISIKNSEGQILKLRALLDIGSQRSFITESAVQLLGLRRSHSKLSIGGIGCSEAVTTRGIVNVTAAIESDKTETFLQFSALIIPKITAILPSTSINVTLPNRIKRLKLADPEFNRPAHIDILLGADIYGSILDNGFIPGNPCAQNTKLGWVLFGSTGKSQTNSNSITFVATEDLDTAVRRFWEIEELHQPAESSLDDVQTENHFSQNTQRELDGTYTVMLPFKDNVDRRRELKESLWTAHIRFRQLEQRLSSHPERQKEYHAFMNEYLALGHMQRVPDHLLHSADCYYLPHHEVIKEKSSTTRLRVVFNASQKTKGGKSLNDVLQVGPTIQNNLFHLLVRWRTHKYVIAADIEKMYRQIHVHENDRDYQRILWRTSKNEPIGHYRLTTVTYGTACAPFLAIRTLQQLAIDERVNYPEASETILRDFYVDDLLTGSDDLTHLQQLQCELRTTLQKGGFHLRKWSANHADLLKSIPESDRESQKSLDIALSEEVKTLGLQWHPAQDAFSFKVQKRDVEKLTKRSILSEVARLFDPLGWLQPCTITGKITIQKLWQQQLGWDEQLQPSTVKDWLETRNQLSLLEQLRIPRWISVTRTTAVELHGFCDASKLAFACAIYLRVLGSDGHISTNLIIAKTRVAPAKKVDVPKPSIARLELCGAVLLAETMKQLKQACNWTSIKTFFWCDSKIVLAWLQKPAATWKVFVANRVNLIHDVSKAHEWHHVTTDKNPADLASRGIRPEQLLHSSLWWKGPEWLTNTDVPTTSNLALSTIEQEAVQTEARSVSIVASEPSPEPEIFTRYSSLPKLLKVMAHINRFTFNARHPNHKLFGPLSFKEIQNAKLKCIQLSQQHAFTSELHAIRSKIEVPKSSCIKSLAPQIDSQGTLRVGGRLHYAPISETAKHPAILPRDSFAKLVVRQAHLTTLHGGTQLVLATIRQQYWITNAQSFVKSILHECFTCFRSTARPGSQLMGQLPPPRFQMEKPFAQTGLDYAGPITIKWNGGRGAKTSKAYIAVFVCLSTKAFHLEAVSELSTAACIAAIRRFIARRGKCHTIYSDCGTNFQGSEKHLKQAFKEATKRCEEFLLNEEIQWQFIPPGSPHFGGLWEAGVKSMKRHLIKAIGQTLLTIEELYTVLAQVEACLNSRPLCEVSNDPTDLAAITPGHFLTGSNLFEIPSMSSDKHVGRKWEIVQQIRKHFWDRWKLEYLNRLQERPKWMTIRPNLQAGELVLVKNDNFPSTHWPLARVIEVHPGPDGLVRVASVKFHGRITRRPVTKLCRLPFANTNPEEPVVTSNQPPQAIACLATTRTTKRKRTKIAPIGDTWSGYLATHSNQPQAAPPAITPKKPRTSISASNLLVSLLVVLCALPQISCNVTVTPLSPGVYIEHLGTARIHRGALKMQLQLPWDNLKHDQANVEAIVTKCRGFCEASLSASTEIGCSELVQHLEEYKDEILHKASTLRLLHNRRRRGVLGNLMTAIFGVNDEVFEDIKGLSENQKKIIRSIDSQSKLMLKTTKTLNSTTGRINTQLQRFQSQLQRGLDRINEFSHWYKTIDHNKLNIHLLAVFKRAENYLDEVYHKYSSLLSSISSRSSIWDSINTNDALGDINHAQTLLPDHLQITYQMMEHTQFDVNESNLVLTTFLPILDTRPYDLIKPTPVPSNLGNNTFQAFDIPSSILGLNYNLQQYFEVTPNEISKVMGDQYVVDISVLYDVNAKPNCVINEIHKVFGRDTCAIHTFRHQGIVWKQLYDSNTWMFATPSAVPGQSVCQGDRQNIILNGTGVVKLTQDCSLKIEDSLFTATWMTSTRNLSVYVLPHAPTFNQTMSLQSIPKLSAPAIIKSEESFGTYIEQQQSLYDDLQTISWSTIRQHGTSITISIIITLGIVSTSLLLIRRFSAKFPLRRNRTQTTWYELPTSSATSSTSTECN